MAQEQYFKHGPNLALYKDIGSHQDYWESHWKTTHLLDVFKMASTGALAEFEYPFVKYLPTKGKILEAGCGTGKYVWALRARGYQIEGIDYAKETVERIHLIDPTLNVRHGDIYQIDKPDGYYAAYISIGVLEHNFEGQQEALSEAFRVLRSGGVGLITVPYLNTRRKKIWNRSPTTSSSSLPNGLSFYQDYINIPSFLNLLQENGFICIEKYPHQLFGGFIRDFKIGRWLNQHHFFSYRLRKIVKWACEKAPMAIRKEYSHMMLFIIKKS